MYLKDEKREPKIMLRLVSLLLALLMWVSFSGRMDEDVNDKNKTFPQVPLIYKEPLGLKTVGNQSFTLTVTLSGADKKLETIKASDISATVNLEGHGAGINTFPISPANIRLAPEYEQLTVASVIPNTVVITLEEVTTKKVPLHLSVVGDPHPDFAQGKMILQPSEVTLEGPSKDVSPITMLISREVDISGATSDVKGSFKLNDELPRGAYLLEALSELNYTIQIREREDHFESKATFNLNTVIAKGEELRWAGWVPAPGKYALSMRGPVSVFRLFNPKWATPQVVLSGASAIYPSFTGNSGQLPPRQATLVDRATFTLSTVWNPPDDFQKEHPNWQDLAKKLEMSWDPKEVEVKKP